MLESVRERKLVLEKNTKVLQQYEERIGYRSQREIKDISRILKLLEKVFFSKTV